MSIRAASKEDSKTLSTLILQASKTVKESDFTDEGWALLEQTNTIEAFNARFEADNYFALVFEIGGVVSGYLAMLDFEKIDHMFVLQQYRGQGICRKLWQQADRICSNNDKGSYYWVKSSTAAEPVYAAFGFSPTDESQMQNGISSRFMEMGNK